MNIKLTFLRLFALAFAVTFFASCDENENTATPQGKYEDGTIVVNAGIFGGQSGDFTYFHSKDSIIKNIFKLENNFEPGGFIQSITTHEDLIFTTINVSGNVDGKLQILNKNTFESIKTIDGDQIFAPRFLKVLDDKAYFTDLGENAYGATPGSSSLSLLNLTSYEVEKRIEVPRLPADLAIVDKKAFVAVDGYFDANFNEFKDSTIQIIDLEKGEITGSITVKKNPDAIVKDNDNNLWVLCSEGFIVKINPTTEEIEATIETSGIKASVKHTFNDDKSKLYFISTTGGAVVDGVWVTTGIVKVLDLATEKVEDTTIEPGSASGIGYNNGKIYIGESAKGTVTVYNEDGTKVDSFTSGDFPGHFLFAE